MARARPAALGCDRRWRIRSIAEFRALTNNFDAEYGNYNGGIINVVTLVLLIVGGLNWGLVGLFDFDLVATLFGEMSALSRIVYTLVGASALCMFGDEERARELRSWWAISASV